MTDSELPKPHLGQYELQTFIGHGLTARVYRAWQSSVKRQVAIKVIDLRRFPGQEDEILGRMQREAEIVARLQHPHILRIYDYGREGQFVYLVMELAVGESLASKIQQSAFNLLSAMAVVQQAAAALDFIHAHGVVHCGLKPTEFLFDDVNNIYLTGFEQAESKHLPALSQGQHVTSPSLHPYTAPEIGNGSAPTPAVDIYALGAIAFEMLTQQRPVDRPDAPLSPGIAPVLRKAFAADPSQRYHTAGAFAQDFTAAVRSADFSPTTKEVFVSYSRKDWTAHVQPLVDHLENAGINVWVDQHLLEGGQDWLDEINKALDRCTCLLLCVSPDALDSKYVKMEYRYFVEENKPIIPVICREAKIPAELRSIQHHPYANFDGLVERLKRLQIKDGRGHE